MEPEDGRRQRRHHNRAAVVQAVLELVAGGELDPTVEDIAARAGLSVRSVFRYFDDMDDLCRAGIARQHELVDSILLDVDVDTTAPLATRVAELVEHRLRLFDAMGKVGDFARLRAPFQPLIAEQLEVARALLRRRLATACGPELTGLGPDVADATLAAADVLCSFEAYRLLREDHGRSRDDAARILTMALTGLLAPAGTAVP